MPTNSDAPAEDYRAPPIAADATHQRIQRTSDYGFDVARSPNGYEVWISYDRPSGQPPRVAYYRLDDEDIARAGSLRIVPAYSPGRSEGSFEVIDLQTSTNARLNETAPFVRASSASGTLAPTIALRDVSHVLIYEHCPIRPHRGFCYLYGTAEELALLHAERAPSGRGEVVELRTPTIPVPATPPNDPNNLEKAFGDTTLLVARISPPLRERGNFAMWVKRGGVTTLLFAWQGFDSGGELRYSFNDVALEQYENRLFAWIRQGDEISLSAAWIDPATLTRIGEAFQYRDAEYDGEELDCGNILIDTRPVVVVTPDGPRLGLVWAGEDSGALFDASGRHVKRIEVRLPDGIVVGNATSDIPALFSLVATEGGGEAMVSLLARHREQP